MDGNFEIYVMDINGDNLKRLTFDDIDDSSPSWSPDGSKILFSMSFCSGRTENSGVPAKTILILQSPQ